MKVLKFGGKAIADANRLKLSAQIVVDKRSGIVVVPAIPSVTAILEDISDCFYKKNTEEAYRSIDRLSKEFETIVQALFDTQEVRKQAQKQIDDTLNNIRSFSEGLFTLFEQRAILSQGERTSAYLFRLLLSENNVNAVHIPALNFMRIDKNREPDTLYIKEKLNELLAANPSEIYITEGYICRNFYDEIDDFRQGGNDYSASLIGAAVKAKEIQIWTDMDSMKHIDEEIIQSAGVITNLSFDEAAELAYFGDKILHPASILPAKLADIPVRILRIFEPNADGTLISSDAEKNKVKAVAAKDNITAITIRSGKMLLAYGFLRRVAEVFELYRTPIDMLASSEVSISLTIDNSAHLSDIVDDLTKYGTVSVDKDMAIICIVGDLTCSNVQVRSQIMEAVSGLPIRMISYGGSEYNFSFLVKKEDKGLTLRMLNDKLF